MTRKDIIRMAREAGVYGPFMGEDEDLERFAQLVAEAEREACAKVCEDAPEPDGYDLAERIRARGQLQAQPKTS